MFKGKNEITKLSNSFFLFLSIGAILSIIKLISVGVDGIKGYNSTDYYFNFTMMCIYLILSIIILIITNKAKSIYKDDYPVTRRIFNLCIIILFMSTIITLFSNVFGYLFYKKFSWYSFVVMFFGYISIFIISIIKVSKTELLSVDNSAKVNIANLAIILLLINYCCNAISIIFGMIFKVDEIITLVGALCFSFIWIMVILISYKLINKDK